MSNIIFLNSSKINFDDKLDFSLLDKLGKVTKYEDNSDEEILERVKDQEIVNTKSLNSVVLSEFNDLVLSEFNSFNNEQYCFADGFTRHYNS